VINWNKEQTVNLAVRILDLTREEVDKIEYSNIFLEGGRTVNPLEPFRPEIEEGYY
jgi:hypothetical protein